MGGIVDHDFTIIADFMTLPRLVIHWLVGCMIPECMVAVVPNGGYDQGKGRSLKEPVWSAYMDREH